MTVSSPFDPSLHSLENHQRLRIVRGTLFLEDVSTRKNTNFIYRFITRSQYSQSTILAKMNRLYQQTEKNNNLTHQFIHNYQFLINKADQQNERYQDVLWIIRFFKAKMPIDTLPHHTLLNTAPLNKLTPSTTASPQPALEVQPKPMQTNNGPSLPTAWWGEGAPDEEVLLIPEFGALACPYPDNLLAFVNPALHIEEANNTPKNLKALLKTLGLVYIQDFIDKGLTSREKFVAYLEANASHFTHLILMHHSDFVKKN